MKRLILMLQFMTRLPIPIKVEFNNADLGKGNVWFPLIGAIVGLWMAGVYWLSSQLMVDGFLPATLTLVAYIWITGGLHLDGLADTFDGLWSNRPRERVLEIMKDSRLGTFGALGLLLLVLLNIGSLEQLTGQWVWVIVAPVLGRYACVFGNTISTYARPEGMGRHFVEDCGWSEFGWASVFTWPVVYVALGLTGLMALLIVLGFTYLFTRWVQSKLGGITGDIMGAVIELNQLLVWLLAVIYWNWQI